VLTRFLERHPHGVAISASKGEGIPALLSELGTQLRPFVISWNCRLPHEKIRRYRAAA